MVDSDAVVKYVSVIVHGVLVLALAALAAPLLFSVEGDGVNVGALFASMPLVVLGLPWSLPFLVVLGLDTSLPVHIMLFVLLLPGAALLNVVVHYRWLQGRHRAAALRIRP